MISMTPGTPSANAGQTLWPTSAALTAGPASSFTASHDPNRTNLIGSRQTIALTAIVGTGFAGDLCVPTRLDVQAGLELVGEQHVELADGTKREALTFAGSVRFFGRTRAVRIILTSSEDALI